MKIVVITNRRFIGVRGGLWKLIHNRNLALSALGAKIDLRCVVPAIKDIPEHMTGLPYACEFYTSSRTLRNGRRVWSARRALKAIASDSVFNTDAILVSGITAVPTVLREVRGRVPVYFDSDGTLQERVDYAPHSLRARLGYIHKVFLASRTFPRLSGVLVVSDYLTKECRGFAPNLPTFLVPCACRNRATIETVLRDRSATRQALGIAKGDTLLVYSGTMEPWQPVGPMVSLFGQLRDQGIKAHLVLLTPNGDEAGKFVKTAPSAIRDRIRIMECQESEYLSIISGGDLGLVLRDNNATNWAAFPNKADEYWSVGLPVVTTPGLSAIAELIRRHPEAGCVIGSPAELRSDEITRLRRFGCDRDDTRVADTFHALLPLRKEISFDSTLLPFIRAIDGDTRRSPIDGLQLVSEDQR